MNRSLIALVTLSLASAYAAADSLNLDYVKTDIGGGLYNYDFTLSVDQSSSAWTAGDGWSWIIFGDANQSASPMADFSLTSGSPGPFGPITSSFGGHNGPTWLIDASSSIVYWTPTAATDTLTWSGTSSFNAQPGTLLYSELLTQGNASADSFRAANPVPEPATMLALIPGALVLFKRRAAK